MGATARNGTEHRTSAGRTEYSSTNGERQIIARLRRDGCRSLRSDAKRTTGGSCNARPAADDAAAAAVPAARRTRPQFRVADVCDARRWPSPCEVQVPLGANLTADARSESLLRMAYLNSTSSPSVVAQSTNCGGSVMPFEEFAAFITAICCRSWSRSRDVERFHRGIWTEVGPSALAESSCAFADRW